MELKDDGFTDIRYERVVLDENYRKLCAAILAQAVEDYRFIRDKLKAVYLSKGCSLPEIITFLKSEWCKELLSALNVAVTGTEIALILESEKEKERQEIVSTRAIFEGGRYRYGH